MAKMAPLMSRSWKQKGSWRKLKSEVSVTRTSGSGNKAFEACVVIGTGSSMKGRAGRFIQTDKGWKMPGKSTSGYTTSCMFGRNPRAAIVSALSRAVRQMKKRTGAFAAYKR